MQTKKTSLTVIEPQRQKNVGHVRQAIIQISLRIRAVWSESSLGAFWKAKDAKFLHVDKKDWSGCADFSWFVFFGRTQQKVSFLMLWAIYFVQ